MPEPSQNAASAAQELQSFGDYILSNYWGGGSSGKVAKAISAAAQSRASSILAESSLENSQRESEAPEDLQHELTSLLNKYSAENASGTPDFLLAEFLLSTLYHYEELIQKRAKWRGESLELPALQAQHAESVEPRVSQGDVSLQATSKKSIFGGRKFDGR